ncbi:choice-of-anchor Q domain-containing protein [Thiocapsa marina]|uniref:Polymorphic outer membrane protein n=1 Tax=Thiocapsa marina 5811 TaxID=768671 RepID=F9UE65_9GAMM|nr:choice-of-anchor Q domain-containing protein [Thiocapsa marina]EGV17622.1 polymorphic outer membrane protein [Thiocapsa marina 5811]
MMQSPTCPAQRVQAPEVAPAATPNRRFQLAGHALALGSLLLLASGASPAFAACGGVTTVETETELNAAIETFNADTTAESCVYTIQLDSDIVLNESTTPIQNVISGKSLIIEGGGFQVDGQDGVNVQGFDGMQPFAIESGTVVTMNDLTVTGGKPVGGGALKRGGGIRNEGTLTLNRCTVAGNTVDRSGGGIANRGTLVIDSSTISGNVAGTTTDVSAQGGGIYSEGGSVTITNSTISGNDADSGGLQDWGGGIFASGSLTLNSVTITDNSATEGSGIYVDTVNGNLTIGNTILSDNFIAQKDCYFDASGSGSVVDQGYNLFVGSDGCGFVNGDNNNILSGANLEPLADNGGPTQTHAPQLLVSPVIDAGSTSLTVDQRGAARPSGAADDIGAYESQEGCGDSPWSVTNQVELSAAIACFNTKTTAGTYTISIDHGIPANQSTTAINNTTPGVELVIEGNGNSGDWNGNLYPGVRPFLIEADTTVTINDFLITGGNVLGTERGGGIRNLGNLTINRCSISGNNSEQGGGGINNGPGAVMVINDSTIAGNELVGAGSGESGGGIQSEGSLTISNSTVSGNTSSSNGGGIGSSSSLILDSVTVTGNTVPFGVGSGSGLLLGGSGGASLKNSILAGNSGAEDCAAFLFAPSDAGNNLVQTQAGCDFVGGANGNIVGQDPLLGVLRNNGGPTRTHALLAGSPAIDAGDTDLNTDQRGYARPSGAADDIGAFEEAQVGTITVVKETPVPSTTNYFFTLEGGQLGEAIAFSVDTSLEDLDSDGPNDYTDRATFELEAGNYTVTEEVLPAQELGPVAIACEDNTGLLGNFTGPTADISLGVSQDIRCTFTNDSIYWISATAEGSGTVSCSPAFVGQGGSSTCTALPASGFQIKEWSGACAGAGSSTECNLSKITEDQVSGVVFGPSCKGSIDIEKTVKSGGCPGCNVTFEIKVTNTGTCELTDVKVEDPQAPACNKTIGSLPAAGRKTYTCTTKRPANSVSVMTFKDTFTKRRYDNNDGNAKWKGSWYEFDKANPAGAGTQDPLRGNLLVSHTGELWLDDKPNTGTQPFAARGADLRGATSATLTFNWRTWCGIDPADKVVVEVRRAGGRFRVLKAFTGFAGCKNGTESFNISREISPKTQVRFRVASGFGEENEMFKVDDVTVIARKPSSFENTACVSGNYAGGTADDCSTVKVGE